jgi:hypothetical protein
MKLGDQAFCISSAKGKPKGGVLEVWCVIAQVI